MSDEVTVSDAQSILLRPRPFAKTSGRLVLLPLLPRRPSAKPLPTEIWTKILCFVFAYYDQQQHEPSSAADVAISRLNTLLVCKTLKVCEPSITVSPRGESDTEAHSFQMPGYRVTLVLSGYTYPEHITPRAIWQLAPGGRSTLGLYSEDTLFCTGAMGPDVRSIGSALHSLVRSLQRRYFSGSSHPITTLPAPTYP